MVLVKNWPFFQLFFLGNIAHLLQFLIYAAPSPHPPPPLILLATDERKRFQNLKIVLNNKNEKSEDYSKAD